MRLADLLTVDETEVTAALQAGREVWHLDTAGTDGNDFLIMDREAALTETLLRHAPFSTELPYGWRLTRVSAEDWVRLLRAGR